MSVASQSGTDANSQNDPESLEETQAEQVQDENGDLDDSAIGALDEKTQAYVKKLRKEAAAHRKKAKQFENNLQTLSERYQHLEGGLKQTLGLEGDEDIKPEEQVAFLQAQNQQAVMRAAILESAVANNIPRQHLGYYQYLLTERMAQLEEGEEFGEEDFAEIVGEVQKLGGYSQGGSTSIAAKGQPAPGNRSGVSLDQFVSMSLTEKSALYQKDPNLYTQLMTQARKERKI